MSLSHEKRCCALQALFQADQGGTTDFDLIRTLFEARAAEKRDSSTPHEAECDFSPAAVVDGMEWARDAWALRDEADAAVRERAPEWPTNRQPAIDRNILRLGYWEIRHHGTPVAVVINEAVELAKAYGTEKSPAFVNGVLDAIAKSAPQEATE